MAHGVVKYFCYQFFWWIKILKMLFAQECRSIGQWWWQLACRNWIHKHWWSSILESKSTKSVTVMCSVTALSRSYFSRIVLFSVLFLTRFVKTLGIVRHTLCCVICFHWARENHYVYYERFFFLFVYQLIDLVHAPSVVYRPYHYQDQDAKSNVM